MNPVNRNEMQSSPSVSDYESRPRRKSLETCPGGCTFVTRGVQSIHQHFNFQGPTHMTYNSFAEPGEYTVHTHYIGGPGNGAFEGGAVNSNGLVSGIPSGNPAMSAPFGVGQDEVFKQSRPNGFIGNGTASVCDGQAVLNGKSTAEVVGMQRGPKWSDKVLPRLTAASIPTPTQSLG